ncbi:MAG: Saccharopine dehydrogenase, partial [Labilithrix sp.]|nr:Saccharopine dehydrogenase [Labilithrix sp.]
VDGDRSARAFTTVDGTEIHAHAYSVLDNLSLAARTEARSIRFDFALGESATRRRGGPFSTEFVVELKGVKKDGTRGSSRHELVHPQGQAPMTAVGVSVIVERLLGLVGTPLPPGLYLPDGFIEPTHMLERLTAFGTQIRSE